MLFDPSHLMENHTY